MAAPHDIGLFKFVQNIYNFLSQTIYRMAFQLSFSLRDSATQE